MHSMGETYLKNCKIKLANDDCSAATTGSDMVILKLVTDTSDEHQAYHPHPGLHHHGVVSLAVALQYDAKNKYRLIFYLFLSI